MALFRMEIHAQVLGDDGEPWADSETFANVNEGVMEQLIALGAVDPFVYAELKKGWVEFSVTVEAGSELDALQEGFSLIRTAIHAAGQQTKGWDRLLRNLKPSAELQPA